jgi:hypothetical protein
VCVISLAKQGLGPEARLPWNVQSHNVIRERGTRRGGSQREPR